MTSHEAAVTIHQSRSCTRRRTLHIERTTALSVVDAGLALGVTTLVIMSPLIYGRGTGIFNRTRIQIPVYIRAALATGRTVVRGRGNGERGHVHVEDLPELYRNLLAEVLVDGGERLLMGKRGFVFSSNGRHSWREVAQVVADACHGAGIMQDNVVQSVGLRGAAVALFGYSGVDDPNIVEMGYCSNPRTVSTVARSPGWRLIRGQEAWKQGFDDSADVPLGVL